MYDWNFGPFVPYIGAFLRGALISLSLAIISSIIGTLLGFIGALFLHNRILGPWLRPVNDGLRAIPMLVLLFFFFYFPYDALLGITPLSEFSSALAALTLAQTVFTADLVRGAYINMPNELILAGRALGLRKRTILGRIILPNLFKQILPTLIAFYIGNLKLSSLASVIGCRDIVFVAKVAMGQTYRALEAWILVAIIYISIVVPFGLLARRIESSTWISRRP